jgi:hypothetical protein
MEQPVQVESARLSLGPSERGQASSSWRDEGSEASVQTNPFTALNFLFENREVRRGSPGPSSLLDKPVLSQSWSTKPNPFDETISPT